MRKKNKHTNVFTKLMSTSKEKIVSVGIDVSKDELVVSIILYSLMSQTFRQLTRFTEDNTPAGIGKVIKKIRSKASQNGHCSVRVTMEATGVYYEELALRLFDRHREYHVSVMLPSKAKKLIEGMGNRSKTDRVDADALAQCGAERRLEAWKGIDPYWRELRSLTRTREELQNQKTRLENQIHALTHSGSEAELALESYAVCLEAIKRQVDVLTTQSKAHLRKNKAVWKQVKDLESIPGIGMVTIAAILAETNGFTDFTSIGQLISFSGYDVKLRESGKWKGQSRISKQGNSHIRRAMYMPAMSVSGKVKTGPIREFYDRLAAREGVKGTKMKAQVALQKKLLTYMFILWKKKERFNPDIIDRDRKGRNKKVASPIGETTGDMTTITLPSFA